MEPEALVREIGGLEIVRRLPGGAGAGAYEVRTDGGARAVLKFAEGGALDFERAARTTSALRERGYPAPRYLRTGRAGAVGYGVAELLPGTPLADLPLDLFPALLTLVDLQADVGLRAHTPWVGDVVTSVVDGRVGYCEHDAMRAYSPETRDLLDRLRMIAGAAARIDVSTADVVHFDFHTRNMVSDGSRITGVFDWEGTTSGDRAFDLVTQALYTSDFELRDALLDAARARTDPRALPLYAAHMVLRQVDWSIRHHGEPEVRWFLDVGTALLDAVGAG